jgi:hypothetical protein
MHLNPNVFLKMTTEVGMIHSWGCQRWWKMRGTEREKEILAPVNPRRGMVASFRRWTEGWRQVPL